MFKTLKHNNKTNKQIKMSKDSVSLILMEKQIKTVRHQYIAPRALKIRQWTISYAGKDVKSLKH
jgi:hypothetical protein